MAKKSPKTASKKTPQAASSATTKVTRITASDDAPIKKTEKAKSLKAKKQTAKAADIIEPASNQTVTKEKKSVTAAKASTKAKKPSSAKRNPIKIAATPLTMFIGYVKGAWYELRQVRWPNRRATWGLTGALIAFTLFFVLVILLLDGLFKYFFELILG